MSLHGPIPPSHGPSPLDNGHYIPDDAIRIGGSPSRVAAGPVDDAIRIGDNDEPIGALENIIKQQTGKELKDCGDIKIRGTFQKDSLSKAVYTIPYRDPPQNPKEPFCYSFERRWTVTVKDKFGRDTEFTVSKRFYSTVAIPSGSEDPNLHSDRENVALMAASYYGKFIESAIALKAGNSSEVKIAGMTIDHVKRVQEDNFLAATAWQGKNRVSPNKLKKGMDRSSSFVTHLDLHIRAVSTKEKSVDAKDRDATLRINLTGKKVNKKGGEVLKAQVHREKRCLIKPDASTPVEIREIAKVQSFRYLQERIDAGQDPQELIDSLDNDEIDQRRYVSWLEQENDRHLADFQERISLLSDPKSLPDLAHKYAPGFPTISQETRALFPKESGKVGKFFEKIKFKKPPQAKFGSVVDTLRKASKKAEGEQKKEIDLLLACCSRAFKEMDDLDKAMTRNEESAEKIQELPQEVIDGQIARVKTLRKLYRKFDTLDDSLLETPKPAPRPHTAPPPNIPLPPTPPPAGGGMPPETRASPKEIVDELTNVAHLPPDEVGNNKRLQIKADLEGLSEKDVRGVHTVITTIDYFIKGKRIVDNAQQFDIRPSADLNKSDLTIEMKENLGLPPEETLALVGGYLLRNNSNIRILYDLDHPKIYVSFEKEKEKEKESLGSLI